MVTKNVAIHRRRYLPAIRRRRGGHKKPTMSLAVLAGLSVPMVSAYQVGQASGAKAGLQRLAQITTGIDPINGQFMPTNLRYGLLPILAGAAVHKTASWLGVNRAIASSGIPFVRI